MQEYGGINHKYFKIVLYKSGVIFISLLFFKIRFYLTLSLPNCKLTDMRKVLLQLFSILSISLIISCEKEDEQFPPVANNEKNIILLPDGGNLVTRALEINNSIATYDILRVDRNTTNAGE